MSVEALVAPGGQTLVAAERAGQADQDGRPSGAARAAFDLSVVRGVGSSTCPARNWRFAVVGAGFEEVVLLDAVDYGGPQRSFGGPVSRRVRLGWRSLVGVELGYGFGGSWGLFPQSIPR